MSKRDFIRNQTSRNLVKQTRWLAQFLIFSVALNVGLVLTLIYTMTGQKDHKKEIVAVENAAPIFVDSRSMFEMLKDFRKCSFRELVDVLEDDQEVENGYSRRDLALASLVSYHFFNMEKALGGEMVQGRRIVFEEPEIPFTGVITVFPGVTDQHYLSIINYVDTERWPLTFEGLYALLTRQKESEKIDDSLAKAFYLTDEFNAIEMLFSRSDIVTTKKDLLDMVLEGDVDLLKDVPDHVSNDLLENIRRRLLLGYIEHKSPIAARLILRADRAYATRKLSDEQVIFVLDAITEPSRGTEQFILDILDSPRGDEVVQAAGCRLSEHRGDDITVAQTSKATYYIIQDGDNLWNIARDHDVNISEIRRVNNLDTDLLIPGTELIIP
jgi:LysM repeat protein